MNLYSTKQWKTFRLEILERDGFVCQQCGRSQADGAVLQVHHKSYTSGRLPWQYDNKVCETLCKRCHAVEHGEIPPAFGWELLGMDDLGDLSGECDHCGTEIRYVFLIGHPKWDTIEVGTDCCDKLTRTDIASKYIKAQKSYESRLERFLSSTRWGRTKYGGYRISQGEYRIQVLKKASQWYIKVNGYETGKLHATPEHAMRAVFENIENGTVDRFVKSMSR